MILYKSLHRVYTGTRNGEDISAHGRVLIRLSSPKCHIMGVKLGLSP